MHHPQISDLTQRLSFCSYILRLAWENTHSGYINVLDCLAGKPRWIWPLLWRPEYYVQLHRHSDSPEPGETSHRIIPLSLP